MEFDFSGFSEVVKKALKILFGGQIPEYISKTLAILVIVLAILIIVYASIWLTSHTVELFNEKLKPYFYDNQKKRRRNRRQRFSEHIRSEITRLNNQESWEDYRFTELEAEVEAQGKQRKWLLFWIFEEKLSREKSLSKALNKSAEKVILLEGDPGSGKSIALRHLALKLAKKASKSRNHKSTIPIYINLKSLERDGQNINQNFIRNYIYKTLNRVNSRDVDIFLEDEFDRGLEEGTWLFLFDSFDEIPEVLGSVEADEKIQKYAEAINDFLGGFNHCRGIISSREYRGPKVLKIPKFRILPLSETRQRKLIKNIDLDGIKTSQVIGELGVSSHGLKSMASNPMFLSLLCEYISQNKDFPKSSYLVYEKYIENRLERDSERLTKRFNLTLDEVRFAAESLAYCMTAEDNLGLSPSRKELLTALEKHDLRLSEFPHRLLDALEFLKIARTDGEAIREEEKSFTFSHRRFQEYFATSFILNEPDRVTPIVLLTNGKWRETTVVLLQTQPEEYLADLLALTTSFIEASAKKLGCIDYAQVAIFLPEKLFKNTKILVSWPADLLHVLSILQEGLVGDKRELPVSLQRIIDDLLSFVTTQGTLLDRKISLEVSGIASREIQEKMLEFAFMTNSKWIHDVAYTQTSYLPKLNSFLKECIRYSLLRKAYSGNLYQHIQSSKTFIQRLNSADLLDAFRLVSNIPVIDLFSKSSSLITLLFLRNRTFADFFDSHHFYELITDSLILFLFIALILVLTKLIPRRSNTKRKLASKDFLDIFILLSSIILLYVSMAWLFWNDEFSSLDPDFSKKSSPLRYLSNLLFSESTNAGSFVGILWLFLSVMLYGFLWKLKAINNLQSGKYLKWYWWPFYQILVGWEIFSGFFKNNFSIAREMLATLFDLPLFLISTVKKVILYVSRQKKQKKFQIFILTIALFFIVHYWRISLLIAITFCSFYVTLYFIFHVFYLIFLWVILIYLERSVELRMREISCKRREEFFQKIINDKNLSLSLISEGLEKRNVLDADSFDWLVDILHKNIKSINIDSHDIEYVKLLALQIENFHGSSPPDDRSFSKEYFQKFKPPFLNKEIIGAINFLNSLEWLIPLHEPYNSAWFSRWEDALFKFSDMEDLQAFTGRVKVDLSDKRFIFMRDHFWAERLYIFLENVERFEDYHH